MCRSLSLSLSGSLPRHCSRVGTCKFVLGDFYATSSAARSRSSCSGSGLDGRLASFSLRQDAAAAAAAAPAAAAAAAAAAGRRLVMPACTRLAVLALSVCCVDDGGGGDRRVGWLPVGVLAVPPYQIPPHLVTRSLPRGFETLPVDQRRTMVACCTANDNESMPNTGEGD
jgi:hypothetical protein